MRWTKWVRRTICAIGPKFGFQTNLGTYIYKNKQRGWYSNYVIIKNEILLDKVGDNGEPEPSDAGS